MLVRRRHAIVFVIRRYTVKHFRRTHIAWRHYQRTRFALEIDDAVLVNEGNVTRRFHSTMALNAILIENRLNIAGEIDFCICGRSKNRKGENGNKSWNS